MTNEIRPIDANALEADLRRQFESVYKNIRDTVSPEDFYIERRSAYEKKLMRLEIDALCKYVQGRPTLQRDALVLIEKLQAENAQLRKERDAALNELKEHAEDICTNCLHAPYEKNKYPCSCCWTGECEWEWRGVQEEKEEPK